MDRPIARTGYATADLAYIHDAGFGFHARAATEELLRYLRGAGHEQGLVVDLGCGTGILSRIMGDAGYEVLGHDQSAEMLKIARRNAPQARFKRASFVDVDFPECVAVTAVGEVLGYAFDSRARRPAIRSLFHRVRAALRPGGVFLFDVAGPGRGPARASAGRSSKVRTGRSAPRRPKTVPPERSAGTRSSSGDMTAVTVAERSSTC